MLRANVVATPIIGTAIVSFVPTPASSVAPVYESPHVHPIDVTTNQVLVVNTPDARLSVFDSDGNGLTLVSEIPVGMEPTSVRALNDSTAWVVNHLSDDVSVVDLVSHAVIATIALGDEPADVAFVPDPTAPGESWAVISLSQEDRIAVVEADFPYTEVASIDIPGSDPRALCVSGSSVWVTVFESGNKTTIVPRRMRVNGPWAAFDPPVPPIDPPLNPALPDSLLPDNGVIVRKVGGDWLDVKNGNWNSVVTWDVADIDLVEIDCSSFSPVMTTTVTGVGTLIYDVTTDPTTGDLWVVNTEAHNEIYFEQLLTGAAVRNRVSQVSAIDHSVSIHGLNEHVDVGAPGSPTPPSAPSLRDDSIALPNDALVSSLAGTPELYITGMGGARLAVVDLAVGDVVRRLPLSRGASGIAERPGGTDFVVVNRFANTLELVDPVAGLTSAISIASSAFDPTDPQVKAGREHLYSAEHSAHGTFSCASCHAHGNFDQLGWDLGDPTGELVQLDPADNGGDPVAPFHPLKGPMVTQSLRGLRDNGLMHWRGDRADLPAFNPAFEGLLGGSELSSGDMLDFEAFTLAIEYPPHPLRGLDDAPPADILGGSPIVGRNVFDTVNNAFCVRCHAHPNGTTGFVAPIDTVDGLGNQPMKIAQLRNLHEKVGFDSFTASDNKLGFGFSHDGSEHTLDDFLDFFLGFYTEAQLIDVRAFLLSFPSGTHGATGHQVAMHAANLDDPDVVGRHAIIEAEADAARIDLVAHTTTEEGTRGFYRSGGSYHSDRMGELWTFSDLTSLAENGATVTFMAVPVGQGIRMGLDRDEDGYFDRTEIDFGTDPADPLSRPTVAVEDPPPAAAADLSRVTRAFPQPFRAALTIDLYIGERGPTDVSIFDVRGRRVRRLVDGPRERGGLAVTWDGRDSGGRAVAAGTYIVRLQTRHAMHSRKIVRVR